MSATLKTKPASPDASEDAAAKIADNVAQIAAAVTALRVKLTDRAILALLQDATGLPKSTIKRVIEGMSDLRRLYVK